MTPDAGSDPGGTKTRAKKSSDGDRLTGSEALSPNVSGLKRPSGCLNRAHYGIS